VRTFDAWLMNQRSRETIKAYSIDFAQWRAWYMLRDLTLEQAAQLDQLVAYRNALDELNFSHATIARKLSVVRMALDAARDAGLITHHAAHSLKGYHVSSISSRHALDDEAVRAILRSQIADATRRARLRGALAALHTRRARL
jgi:site-specific recombinase XerD